jgi:hypothetical protein
MGFLNRVHKSQKSAEKEKSAEFIKRIEELSQEYGLAIIPVITPYGPRFEIQKRAENKESNEPIREERSP